MKKAALKKYFDKKLGIFTSGPHNQISVLGQTWMIKSGVIKGETAQKAIRIALANENTVMPSLRTPHTI